MPDAIRLECIEAVVIGTSAGGVEALSHILPRLRPNGRTAFFIVLHLPRARPSQLVPIFAPKCRLAVREAEDKEPVMPDTIYFAAPDYHLLLDEGAQIALSSDDLVNYSRPSIDVLFESAADLYADRVMGIILTGANADGAAGLQAIHAAGGITVVQDPETALSPLMAESALKRTAADYILTLDGIASLLQALRKEP